ncbi:hypothetical protein G6F24_018449 [Rhizopus arrhizus]|nr:hypothetical protein G6F24_018449 [Rhizopus arrhizus]
MMSSISPTYWVAREVGDFANAAAGFNGAADDFVVNVRDVADVIDSQPAGAQPALHDVERDQHAGMAKMAEVIHGHATHVHAHLTSLGRFERFFGTR